MVEFDGGIRVVWNSVMEHCELQVPFDGLRAGFRCAQDDGSFFE
jgi:hypothetical protein